MVITANRPRAFAMSCMTIPKNLLKSRNDSNNCAPGFSETSSAAVASLVHKKNFRCNAVSAFAASAPPPRRIDSNASSKVFVTPSNDCNRAPTRAQSPGV